MATPLNLPRSSFAAAVAAKNSKASEGKKPSSHYPPSRFQSALIFHFFILLHFFALKVIFQIVFDGMDMIFVSERKSILGFDSLGETPSDYRIINASYLANHIYYIRMANGVYVVM